MIHFLEYTADPVTRRILLRGRVLKVSALNFDLLMYFLQHPGEVLSRQRLLDEVWRGRVVADNTLSKQITRLKEELHIEAAQHDFIQTVRGKGFVFSAAVQHSTDDAPTPANHRPGRRRTASMWLLGVLILSAGALIWRHNRIADLEQVTAQMHQRIERLALLYDAAQDPVETAGAQALAGALRARLLANQSFNIRLQQRPVGEADFTQLSEELIADEGYDSVVYMHVTRHAQGFNAQVILRHGTDLLPSARFESESQQALIRRVADWINAQALAPSESGAERVMTASDAAFEAYVQASQLGFQNRTQAAIDKAREALRIDPDFKMAQVELAQHLRVAGQVDQAIELLAALPLDDTPLRFQYRVNKDLGVCHYRLGHQRQAVAYFQAAIEQARTLEDASLEIAALINQSYMYADLQQSEKARDNLERALLLVDRHHEKYYMGGIYSGLTSAYRRSGQLDKALEYAQKSHEFFSAANNSDLAHTALGKWADILLDAGQYARSNELQQTNLGYSLAHDMQVNRLFALKGIVRVDLVYGRFVQAREDLARFAHWLAEIDNGDLHAEYLELQTMLSLGEGDWIGAARWLDQLQQLLIELQNPDKHTVWQNLQLDVWLRSGEKQRAIAWLNDLGSAPDDIEFQVLAALVRAEESPVQRTAQTIEEALQRGLELKLQHRVLQLMPRYIDWLLQRGDQGEAVAHWLQRLESLQPPPYPHLWLRAQWQASLGRSSDAVHTLESLQQLANGWWGEAQENLLQQLREPTDAAPP